MMPPLCRPAFASEAPSSATVPFILDDNRMFAWLAFVRPDGSLRKALAFVDLGTPALVLKESLSRDLHIGRDRPLVLRLGDMEIPIESSNIQMNAGSFLTGPKGRKAVPVEAVLPGSVMKNYQVVFDYAGRSLTLASPDTLAAKGIAVPCRVNERTGLISVGAIVGGRLHAVAVDSGSAHT
jgi:hypothetical protein